MSTLRANELKKLDDTNWVGTGPAQVPTNDMLDAAGYKTEDELNAAGYKTEDELNDVGFAQSVDSVSALRLATFPASLERLWLSGYHGVGTAGGRELYADRADTASADDGTDVFVDAGGVRWKSVERYYDADYAARLQAVMDAERIRRNAGVLSYITPGAREGAGTTGATLTDTTRINIASETDAQNAADSGTGTLSDPYVIQNRKMNNSEATTNAGGFAWNDPSGDVYYIKLLRCEISGYQTGQIRVVNGSGLFVESCTIFDPANPWFSSAGGGANPLDFIYFDKCLVAGADTPGFDGRNNYRFTDCVFNDSRNAWVTGAKVLDHRGGSEFLVNHCTFNTGTAATHYSIEPGGAGGVELNVSNTLFVGGGSARLIYMPASSSLVQRGLIENCILRNPGASQVEIGRSQNLEIRYCDFEDSPDGTRQCWFTSRGEVGVRDSRVHHCKFTKTTGTNSAGNECLETFTRGWNVEFDHNWITDCPEDAIEHAQQVGGCTVHHCVVDNTQGQAVDIFKAMDPDGGSVVHRAVSTEIHHIYGRCGLAGGVGGYGVIVDDADDVRVHSIFVDNSQSTAPLIRIRNRDLAAGAGPNDCSVIGPLSLPRSIGNGEAVQIDSDAGTDNTAIWQEGGRIRRIGQSTEEEDRTQIV